jgi:hypothetical protein
VDSNRFQWSRRGMKMEGTVILDQRNGSRPFSTLPSPAPLSADEQPRRRVRRKRTALDRRHGFRYGIGLMERGSALFRSEAEPQNLHSRGKPEAAKSRGLLLTNNRQSPCAPDQAGTTVGNPVPAERRSCLLSYPWSRASPSGATLTKFLFKLSKGG